MKLTLDDLMEKCDQCDGSGHIPTPTSVSLAGGVRCVRCDDCDGSGYLPTATGQAILEFLECMTRSGRLLPRGLGGYPCPEKRRLNGESGNPRILLLKKLRNKTKPPKYWGT